jgi:redox-sensitive bicupin YhaK (pirin superfamily)
MIPIIGKRHDLGDGFLVTRVLPQAARRSIGPFVFFDYFGPVDFPPGKGVDVRPHPHIGLATVTYLFEGAQMHRDTLGSVQEIKPGDVNWMTAGRGIAHSERSPAETRTQTRKMLGIQSWVALPQAFEETEPGFFHHQGATLPQLDDTGITLRVIAGTAYGAASPVKVYAGTLYCDVSLAAQTGLPLPSDHEERALYLISGEVEIAGEKFAEGQLLVFRPRDAITITAATPARLLLLGGEKLDGPRHIWWNFVSSSQERIEQAKEDWRQKRFGLVPGDEQDFIPLPG